ncbi:hypothetical protein BDR07DRAFT_396677 [Suillus spraguei]|nr:hypothetical protein BDR07DRAFT_396677 [Suillus spraguei]
MLSTSQELLLVVPVIWTVKTSIIFCNFSVTTTTTFSTTTMFQTASVPCDPRPITSINLFNKSFTYNYCRYVGVTGDVMIDSLMGVITYYILLYISFYFPHRFTDAQWFPSRTNTHTS